MKTADFICYVISQVAGAFIGAGILRFLVDASNLDPAKAGLGQNGFAEYSMSGISMWGALVVEIVLKFIFVFAVLGVTSDPSNKSVAGIVIGGTHTLVHTFPLIFDFH